MLNTDNSDDLCGDISRDNIIDTVAMDILEKLPKPFEIWRVREMLQMKLSPTGVVLLQELERYNGLVERMEKTLQVLRMVCCPFFARYMNYIIASKTTVT